MQQIWKKHPIYQNYAGSNFGNIKSLNFNHTGKEKTLIKSKNIIHQKKRDYITQRFSLCYDNKSKSYSVSRFIYECFYGIISEKMQVDHIDNNPQNNRLDNLQLLTPSENIKKKFVDNPNYKTNFELINPKTKIICLNNGVIYESQHEAARKLNISLGHINNVLKGKRNHTHGYIFRYYSAQDLSNNLQQLTFAF